IDDITIWSEIKGVFKSIDKGNSDHNINAYNGGLFKDDEVLDNLIIKNHFFDLIDEITTYDFDTDLDVNILGHIFEQSISDIDNLKISLQKGEYNSEKSKKQKLGIYYTPQYITKLILENSLGKYLESIRMRLGENDLPDINSATTPQIKGKYKKKHIEFYNNYINELKKLKILDPACGSGAFLNQTFDYLCEQFDWAYTQKESIIRNKKVVGYRLKLDHIENDILMNNLYGVDINEESIEITRLSLWLKTANKSKRLANLDNNIKCGNSLICDSDVGGEKAFIWKKEFPAIMNDDGFDIIIGNPPYGFDFNSKEKSILKRQYPDVPDYESAYFFLEKCYKLLKQNGFLSFIIPNMFMSNIYAKSFRIKLLNDFNLEKIINLSNKDIFIDANVRTCIVVISRKKRNPNDSVFLVNGDKIIRTNKSILLENIDNWLTLFSQEKEIENIINKIRQENCVQLDDVCEITQGLIPYDRYRGHSKETIKNRIWHSEYRKDDTYKKELKGGDVDRYFLNWNGKRWISYGEWLAAPREPKFFKGERILIREITDPYILATYTDKEYYNNPSIINVIRFKNINPFYLLGIINSKLITFFHYHTSPKAKKGLFPKILVDDVRKLYIKKEKEVTQEQLANMVKYILKTKKTCNNFKKIKFIEFSKKYTSTNECYLNSIVNNTFVNKIYSGTATKVRNFTVNINYNIIGLYTDKSGSGKYQILKFEENDKYKRKYIKLYLEHMTQEQLDQINCTQNGNLMEKVLSINIPDYNKRKVVKKVVEEWERLQQRLKELEDNIEKIQYDIDQMVYNLYGLNNNEINIVEDSL
ncbi:MAG: Eco57I restriction-modification methylase domain-containing protein, partial [bacterium]